MAEDQLAASTRLYGRCEQGAYCDIYPNEAFAYHRLPMEQPQRDANGKVLKDSKGQPKADGSLRAFEQEPLLDDPDEYFRREVLPHVPAAFLDLTKTKEGYEINCTRYLYQYQPLRKRQDIRADLRRLETKTQGLLQQVIS